MPKQKMSADGALTHAANTAACNDISLLSRRDVLAFIGAGAAGAICSGIANTAVAAETTQGPFWEKAGVDIMDAIFSRRSTREFTGESMPQETLKRIIAAGMNAPSANNIQPWRFVVLQSKQSLARIPKLIPLTDYATKAGAATLVCVELNPKVDDRLAILSVACCIQNMLLACCGLGYGGVWMQVYPKKDMMSAWQTELGLPEKILPLVLVTMGKPAVVLPPVNRLRENVIHEEKWKEA